MGKAFVNSVPASLSYHNFRGFSAAKATGANTVAAHAKVPNTKPSVFIRTPKNFQPTGIKLNPESAFFPLFGLEIIDFLSTGPKNIVVAAKIFMMLLPVALVIAGLAFVCWLFTDHGPNIPRKIHSEKVLEQKVERFRNELQKKRKVEIPPPKKNTIDMMAPLINC